MVERNLTIDDINAELWDADRKPAFRRSTLMERHVISEILAVLLVRAETGDLDLGWLAAKAARIDFRLEVWRVDGAVFWALLERQSKRRGAGAYIVRVARSSPTRVQVILQAPHAYYDIGTGLISTRLFFGGHSHARALFTNTIHRYWNVDGSYQPREDSAADLCHRVDHVFQYATDAAARVLGEIVVIQLHGFANHPKRPDAIISAGDANGSTPMVLALQQRLGDFLGKAKRFPEETEELGGTTNVQGRMLHNHQHAHFVHLEMSRNTRKRLLDSPEELARFGQLLVWDRIDDSLKGDDLR